MGRGTAQLMSKLYLLNFSAALSGSNFFHSCRWKGVGWCAPHVHVASGNGLHGLDCCARSLVSLIEPVAVAKARRHALRAVHAVMEHAKWRSAAPWRLVIILFVFDVINIKSCPVLLSLIIQQTPDRHKRERARECWVFIFLFLFEKYDAPWADSKAATKSLLQVSIPNFN